MVLKYTVEELLAFESSGNLPEGVDLAEFNKLIEDVKIALAESEEFQVGGRRKSFTHAHKKRAPKETKQVDADGWTTFTAPVKTRKSVSNESEDPKLHTMKVKTSSSKISGGRASVNSSDTVAINQVATFNVFDALEDDKSDDEE